MQEIGTTIKNTRKAQKISTHKLAELAGVSQSYISQLENGRKKNPPSPEVIKKIATALNLDFYRLMRSAGHLELVDSESSLNLKDILSSLADSERDLVFNKLHITDLPLNKIDDEELYRIFINNARFGDYIYILRIHQKLSIKDLSDFSSLSKDHIEGLEDSDKYNVAMFNSKMIILSRALGIENIPRWIVQQIDNPDLLKKIIINTGLPMEVKRNITFEVPKYEILKDSNGQLSYKSLSDEELKERFFSINHLLDRNGNVYYKDRILTDKEREKIKIMLETILD